VKKRNQAAKDAQVPPPAPAPAPQPVPDFSNIRIDNNVFTTKVPETNEHTRAAVVALAAAAQANADAISNIAKALKGSDIHQNAPMLNFGHNGGHFE
jgi:hypothetical protein